MHFIFFCSYNLANGLKKYFMEVFMLAFLLNGFLHFLESAIFLVGYISNNSLFPEPLSSSEEQYYLELLSQGNDFSSCL